MSTYMLMRPLMIFGYIKSIITNNFPSHKINESAEVKIHLENGLLYLDSEDVIHEALSLCKQIGYLHKDILVTFEEHSDKIYIQYGEDKETRLYYDFSVHPDTTSYQEICQSVLLLALLQDKSHRTFMPLLTYVGNGFNSERRG